MSNIQRYKILALHHDALLRAGIVTSLSRRPDFEVFGDLIDAQRTDDPIDVIVVDYHQAMHLLEARQERGPLSGARILALTSNDREVDVRRALEAGVHGYMLLGSPLQEIVDGVAVLAHGGRSVSPIVASRMVDSFARVPLTSRESEILKLIVKGRSNKLIARELHIKVGTVKSHVSAIFNKLDASSRTHAAAVAMNRGLVAEEDSGLTESRLSYSRVAAGTAGNQRPVRPGGQDPVRQGLSIGR